MGKQVGMVQNQNLGSNLPSRALRTSAKTRKPSRAATPTGRKHLRTNNCEVSGQEEKGRRRNGDEKFARKVVGEKMAPECARKEVFAGEIEEIVIANGQRKNLKKRSSRNGLLQGTHLKINKPDLPFVVASNARWR